jgi:hypothetical protein
VLRLALLFNHLGLLKDLQDTAGHQGL